MKYYQVKRGWGNCQIVKTDARGRLNISGFLVADELYTPAEYRRIFTGATIRGGGIHEPEAAFNVVNVNKNNTYWFFGARFVKEA